MPLFFDRVQQASWAGFPFPVNEIAIIGRARLFVHEYPHADGGNLEPLGREPYRIRMRMTFDENDIFYPNAYPTGLDNLRFLAESGTSSKLVVPNVGTIQAFCPSWTQVWRAMVRSGESAEYEWIEDQSATLKQVFYTGIASAKAMSQRAADLSAQKPMLDSLGVDPSLLDRVLKAANEVVTIRDRADLTAQLAEDKIASLDTALQNIDAAITSPVGYQALESVKRLWASMNDFRQDVSDTIAPPSTYTVPALMSVMDAARNIFGDTARATDLLVWNPIADAFAIPAGSTLRYLAA